MASRGSVAKNSRITDEEYKTISILPHGEYRRYRIKAFNARLLTLTKCCLYNI